MTGPGHDEDWRARIEKKLSRAEAYALGAIAQTVTPNPAWNQAAWFIDPQNLSGNASDSNNGVTALAPKKTWRGVLQAMQTSAPTLLVSAVFTFISSHTDNTDPVEFSPRIAFSNQVQMTATLPAAAASGVLGVVTAKSIATNVLLSAATLPAGAAVGMLVVNTTRGNSRAYVQKSLGGGAFQLSQPFGPQTIPVGSAPTENNAWATGDAVSLFTQRAVNIFNLQPVIESTSGSFANSLAVSNLTIFDPSGVGVDVCAVNGNVSFVECDAQRVIAVAGTPSVNSQPFWHNIGFRGGLFGSTSSNLTFAAAVNVNPAILVTGGYVLLGGAVGNMRFDGDFIVGTNFFAKDGAIGVVAVDTGSVLSVSGLTDFRLGSLYASNKLYGAGTINVAGQGRLVYPSAGGAAVAAFILTPRILLNNGVMASSSTQAAPNVINNVVPTNTAAITAAALDAAAGAAGYGGNVANQGAAFNAGGASIANGAS